MYKNAHRQTKPTQSLGIPLGGVVAFYAVLYAHSPPARAANVAVIEDVSGGGVSWCDFLIAHGHPCTIFPPSGPTGPLDPFQVVIDLSTDWTDPDGSLADFLRAGKGVITRGGVPGALGIETDPVVQAWVGGSFLSLGNGVCRTLAHDAILGSIPLGTAIDGCGDGPCAGLGGEGAFPNTKVLARWESGTTSVGLMRNTWERGQSVYFPYFDPTATPGDEIILRTIDVLSHPIPTISTWGLVVAVVVILILGSLIMGFNQLASKGGKTSMATRVRKLAVVLCLVVGVFPGGAVLAQIPK